MTYANNYTLEVPIMEFNQTELEYLLECLNFHYSENEYIQEEIIDINSQLCKRINEQLVLHRRAF